MAKFCKFWHKFPCSAPLLVQWAEAWTNFINSGIGSPQSMPTSGLKHGQILLILAQVPLQCPSISALQRTKWVEVWPNFSLGFFAVPLYQCPSKHEVGLMYGHSFQILAQVSLQCWSIRAPQRTNYINFGIGSLQCPSIESLKSMKYGQKFFNFWHRFPCRAPYPVMLNYRSVLIGVQTAK